MGGAKSQPLLKVEGSPRKYGRFAAVHVASKQDPRFEQAMDLLTRSFCGTEKANPEPVMQWAYTGTQENLLAPLPAPPSETRLAFFRWLAGIDMNLQVNAEGIWALLDADGVMVAATSSTMSKDPPCCLMMGMVCKTICCCQFPKDENGTSTALQRIGSMKEMGVMHEEAMPGPHLYVRTVATHPEHQGKGAGSALLNLIADIADAHGLPAYLECVGDKNETFYAKKGGYSVFRRTVVEFEGSKLDLNGGIAGMIRPAKGAAGKEDAPATKPVERRRSSQGSGPRERFPGLTSSGPAGNLVRAIGSRSSLGGQPAH